MNADIIPYSKMKDSNVKWLGDVPEHWDILPNRAIFREIKERDRPQEQMLSVTITRGVIKQQTLLADNSKKDSSNLDRSNYKLVRPGDIVYNKMRAWQGAIGMSEYQGIVSPAYVVQRPLKNADPRFLHYLLRTPAFAKEAEQWSYGITSDMWSLRPEHFKMIYVCVPSIPEQASIVRFLNHLVRRIRQYIRAKQKLIKLLDEQKQVIIKRAVTRGLDPNVRLKPSAVEWLGDVPAHWNVRRAKYLFREIDHRTSTGTEILLSLRMYSGLVPHNDVSTVPITPQALVGFKKVQPGQIVMNRMRAAIGMFGIVKQPGIVSPDYAVLEPARQVDPMYFVRLFKTPAAAAVFRIESKGLGTGSSGFMRLYTERFGIIKLPLPPQDEQVRIVRTIEDNIQEIDQNQQCIIREIALLREYLTKIILDVVTGKLDVREAATRLPEESDEPEQLDELDRETSSGNGIADDVEESLEPIEA